MLPLSLTKITSKQKRVTVFQQFWPDWVVIQCIRPIVSLVLSSDMQTCHNLSFTVLTVPSPFGVAAFKWNFIICQLFSYAIKPTGSFELLYFIFKMFDDQDDHSPS